MTDSQTPQAGDEQLTQVGWWCWRGDNHGHLATQACRSDNVPIHVPAEWADEMRAVIQQIEDGDEDEQSAADARTAPCSWVAVKSSHTPHTWAPQPGMDPVHCSGYTTPLTDQPTVAPEWSAAAETGEANVAPHCDGFPTTCPNPVTVPPAPPHHYGGIRCGCYDEEQPS